MAGYQVGLTKRGTFLDAWVFDLPGCHARGGSLDEVRDILPVVIAEHLTWLMGHGVATDTSEPVAIEIVEEVVSQSEFCFQHDSLPLSRDQLEDGIRRCEFAREDLVRLVEPLTDPVLDWRPPASAVRIDEIFPDVRSIREMVDHATNSAGFFVRNVLPTGEGRYNWEETLEVLRGLDENARNQVHRRPNPRTGAESEWSARKVVRRVIDHQRFHTKEVEQRLAWLLLGVPEVLPASRE